MYIDTIHYKSRAFETGSSSHIPWWNGSFINYGFIIWCWVWSADRCARGLTHTRAHAGATTPRLSDDLSGRALIGREFSLSLSLSRVCGCSVCEVGHRKKNGFDVIDQPSEIQDKMNARRSKLVVMARYWSDTVPCPTYFETEIRRCFIIHGFICPMWFMTCEFFLNPFVANYDGKLHINWKKWNIWDRDGANYV